MQHLRYISVFENQLYVITWNEINTLHKFDATNYTTLASNLTSPFALHAFHRQRQPHGTSYITYNLKITMYNGFFMLIKAYVINFTAHTPCVNHDCQDLCIPWKETQRKCVCREGFYLDTDQKSCKRERFLLEQH